MSLRPRQGEGPMVYLNRGQFYALKLSKAGFTSSLHQPRGKVRMSGPTPSHGQDGSQSSGEQCTMGGSELQRDSIVQVREGRVEVEVEGFTVSLLLGSMKPCYNLIHFVSILS